MRFAVGLLSLSDSVNGGQTLQGLISVDNVGHVVVVPLIVHVVWIVHAICIVDVLCGVWFARCVGCEP